MRFFWKNETYVKDVRLGGSLRGLLYNDKRPYRCLLLSNEVDDYLNTHGMAEYIAYKLIVREHLTPKAVMDIVNTYDDPDYTQLKKKGKKQNESKKSQST